MAAPFLTITPIRAHIGYDDVEKLWALKISREEVSPQGTIPWADILEKFATLAELLIYLLQFWAMSGTAGSTATTAENFDVNAFTTWLTTQFVYSHADPVASTGGPATFPGADPDLSPTVTDFGITPP